MNDSGVDNIDLSSDDDDSMDSADIFMAVSQRQATTTAPSIEPTAPPILPSSATSTRILIDFIRKDTLSKLDRRRKQGPDLSESVLEEIGNASIFLFSRRARH
jgi:hypothetical protein